MKTKKILSIIGIVFLCLLIVVNISQTLIFLSSISEKFSDISGLLGELTGIIIIYLLCWWGIKRLKKVK